jgi:hypothetical protein
MPAPDLMKVKNSTIHKRRRTYKKLMKPYLDLNEKNKP